MNKGRIKNLFFSQLWVMGLFLTPSIHAGIPVWTFTPLTATSITVPVNGSATVQYTVTNQSPKTHTLLMNPIQGIQATGCAAPLSGHQSCTLTLSITGSALKGDVIGGPVLCESGNPNQCYQPGRTNELNIHLNNQPPATIYSGIYVTTGDFRMTYSIDNGSTWNPMLNQLGGGTVTVADLSGTLYVGGGGAATYLLYTSDGINWLHTSTLPGSTILEPGPAGGISSGFALNNTVYVGTINGQVYFTNDQGANWTAVPPLVGTDSIDALFVTDDGTIYAGTDSGFIFSLPKNGTSWTATENQPDDSAIHSLAVSVSGSTKTMYVVTLNTSTAGSPLYSADGKTWNLMDALPSGNATVVSVLGATVYAGTSVGDLLYTTTNGASWTTASSQPDGSSINTLFINQSTLSPVFVEASDAVPVSSGGNVSVSIPVKNLSNAVVTNMQAQLPDSLTGVTQTSNNCASVAPQGTCTLTFRSTKPYSPQNIPVTGSGSSETVSRIALAFSMPHNGEDYLVYHADGTTAYVVDNIDANDQVWSDGIPVLIPGIVDNSTYPPCNGATEGKCNTEEIVTYYDNNGPISYDDYAAGLCHQSTSGGASTGDWYLPSICEVGGGLYRTFAPTPNLISCAPVVTGMSSLYSLNLLTNITPGNLYWSSTESSLDPVSDAWSQGFNQGGGVSPRSGGKVITRSVRCAQQLTY